MAVRSPGAKTLHFRPVFVVTHRSRPTLRRQGGTSFTYVLGIESAIDQARAAANGKNVAIAAAARCSAR